MRERQESNIEVGNAFSQPPPACDGLLEGPKDTWASLVVSVYFVEEEKARLWD